MKFRLRGRLLIPTFVLVAALLQSGPLCGQSSTAPASSASDDAAKRLLWLKSRGITAPSTASTTPAPAPTPAPSPAPPKRFAVSRSPDLRTIDLPGATTPAPASKSSATTPPATASTTPRPESTETPAKRSTASSKASATPATTPKSKKSVASKSPSTTPAPSATASTSTDKPAKTTTTADPTTPAPAKDSTPAPSRTTKSTPASPTSSASRTAKTSPETTPAPSKDSTPAPSRTAKSPPASPTPSASRTAKTSPETTPAPSKTTASTGPTVITGEPTSKKSTPGTKPTETPAVTAKSKKGATDKPLATAATPTPTPIPTTPHPVAAKSTPAPKLADTAASSAAARDLLSIPAQNAKLSMPARTTSISPIPTPDPYRLPPVNRAVGGRFPWKTNIVTTVFWIGERPTANNPTPNHASSWDANWARAYGGYDNPDPDARRNFIPIAFTPRQNPFYVALPYNDVTRGTTKPESRLVIPWFKSAFEREGKSVCRDRWVAIRARSGKVAYGQWSDCGPFRTDHWQYVFGNERPRPNLNNGAGLDVSPAIRDFLGLSSTDVTDWKFVDDRDVPPGPWARHGENNTFAQGNRR